MDLKILAIIAVSLLGLTSFLILISWDWRLKIMALSVQYGAIFILIAQSWQIEMAALKLVSGWMAGAVLGIALIGRPVERPEGVHSRVVHILFRVFSVVLVGPLVLSFAPRIDKMVPGISYEQALGGLILIGMGLLNLGFTSKPLNVVLGLLTLLGGFEIYYAVVESSLLVTALLASVILGLAMVSTFIFEDLSQVEH